MRKIWTRHFALGAATAAAAFGLAQFAAPAVAAPTRTVESAQAFLVEMLGKSAVQIAYPIGRLRWGEGYAMWDVGRIEATGRCVTRFHLVPDSVQASDNGLVPDVAVQPVANFDINWSKVTKVAGYWPEGWFSHPAKQFQVTVNGQRLNLYFDVSKAYADRIKVALTYLKDQCVASTDEGF